MEAERIKDIKRREAEEAKKMAQRLHDREVIAAQMTFREHQKLIEEEAREQEGHVRIGHESIACLKNHV